MATRGNFYGDLRTWVTPAIGAGLLGAGLAMALGMRHAFAPLVGFVITGAILSVGQWRLKHRTGVGPTPPA